jgi:hypothetical protein
MFLPKLTSQRKVFLAEALDLLPLRPRSLQRTLKVDLLKSKPPVDHV